jgi:hypothetical protein
MSKKEDSLPPEVRTFIDQQLRSGKKPNEVRDAILARPKLATQMGNDTQRIYQAVYNYKRRSFDPEIKGETKLRSLPFGRKSQKLALKSSRKSIVCSYSLIV